MSTFNFTVRAIDDQKAFSDREFSINVKNSLINNFIVGGTANSFTSTDLDSTSLIQRNGIVPLTSIDYYIHSINPICYGNGIWCVTTSTAGYSSSSDGINWTPGSMPSNQVIASGNAIQYVNNQFVCVTMLNDNSSSSINTIGTSCATLFVSDDLVTWTPVGGLNSIPINYNIQSGNNSVGIYARIPKNVTYGQGKWVIGSTLLNYVNGYSVSGSGFGFVYDTQVTSPSWTSMSIPSINSSVYNVPGGIQYINGLWIFGTTAPSISTGSNVYFTSNDFVIWTKRALGTSGSKSYVSDFYYINGSLVSAPGLADNSDPVAGNIYAQSVMYSTDGITWQNCTIPSSLVRNKSLLSCYNEGKLVLASPGANWLIESSDGRTFTSVLAPGTSTALTLTETATGLASIT